jgi:hypothetical protein
MGKPTTVPHLLSSYISARTGNRVTSADIPDCGDIKVPSMHFIGDTLWSYETPVARMLPDKKRILVAAHAFYQWRGYGQDIAWMATNFINSLIVNGSTFEVVPVDDIKEPDYSRRLDALIRKADHTYRGHMAATVHSQFATYNNEVRGVRHYAKITRQKRQIKGIIKVLDNPIRHTMMWSKDQALLSQQ